MATILPEEIRQRITAPSKSAPRPKVIPPVESGTEEVPAGTEVSAAVALPVQRIDPEARLPEQVAMLHVRSAGDKHYTLLGNGPAGTSEQRLETGKLGRPNLNLGTFFKEYEGNIKKAEEIRNTIAAYSDSPALGDFKKWIRRLTEANDGTHFVIADYTDFELPWEMIELEWQQFLGVLFPITRWQLVSGGDDKLELDTTPVTCAGKVIAYVAEELEATATESELLQELGAEKCASIAILKQHLRTACKGVGLVYLACHGVFHSNLSEIALGSLENPDDQLKIADLNPPQHLFRASNVIVILNACSSGRLRMDPGLGDQPDDNGVAFRRGFVERFLSRGALGVIGTLGRVNDDHAARLGHWLLKRFRVDDKAPLPNLLRELREAESKKLEANPTADDYLSFVYTFMYVYYGNPAATVDFTTLAGGTSG